MIRYVEHTLSHKEKFKDTRRQRTTLEKNMMIGKKKE